ncbi:hypothetical protein [Streptomyces sp. NPDC002564]|uniref:hypothetical protein n=1 Tax=Streptomyces sp. NPDC002564 TaxID=3364649 RepID=UPI00367A6FBD
MTAVAASSALLPAVAHAADRYEVTLDSTARLGADGKARVAGTYTCEGFTGPVRLKVRVRTEVTRDLTPAETETVQGIYDWVGIPGTTQVPKTSTVHTTRERILDGTCDGSATAHPWEHGFSGVGTKDGTGTVTVAMTSVDPATAEVTPLADTTGEVTFA